MSAEDLAAVGVTLRLATVVTGLLLLVGTPLAWWLARTQSRWEPVVAAVVALPLVLPPTVIGFYLLLALGPDGPVGRATQWLGIGLLPFTFGGLVVGALCHSLPFVVQPLRAAFAAVGDRPLEVAATLGAGPWDRFFRVAVPLSAPGIVAAVVVGFAHTIGEFGVVLMLGGNIPGATRVLSMAVYDHVEALEYSAAHTLSGVLLLVSFALLVVVYGVGRRHARSP
ncbi:MAG: molybdate ABC transporter permease subunit [Myxococcales bacterium]|nr:molybdate ABC transporter permease subunit [Myxococcales bacterium]